MSKYIYRQEIATLVEVSIDVVRKSEKSFGILPYKHKVTRKCVRYDRAPAIEALKSRGLISV